MTALPVGHPEVGRSTHELRDLRRARGLSAGDLAVLVSVHRGSIHRWERRERLPGPAHVRALAEALAVPLPSVASFFDDARPPAEPVAGPRGQALRGLRNARGLSGGRLGELLGVPAHTVYNWERGGCRIPVRLVRPLAASLGMDPELLLDVLRRAPVAANDRPRPMSRLAILRSRRRLSQAAAAERLGVSRSSIRAWEAGTPPPLHAVRNLARVYGVPTSELARAAGVIFPRALDPSTWSPGDLPAVLRTLRQWSGLTQQAVAAHCGTRQDTVRAWESGRCQPSDGPRRALESLYRLPGGALLDAYR